MALVMAGLGWIAGWLADWLADVLPRFAADRRGRREPLPPLRPPAIGQALAGRRPAGLGQRLAAEVLSAVALGLIWLQPESTGRALFLSLCWLYFLLVTLIDLRVRLILDVMTLPAMLAALLYHAVSGPEALRAALLGGGLAGGMFAAVAWLRPGDLGGGDVKLALLLGLVFGFPGILWVLLVGVGAGGVVAVVLLARGHSARSSMAYGPFLCLGALIALIYTPLPWM